MSPGHKKRLRRLELRGSPELKAALASGRLSARICETILYMPKAQQSKELRRRLHAQDDAEHRSQVAAETIRKYLDSCDKVNLEDLRRQIRAAIA
jgi:hypothetical protein